jgi:hypothetical protein
MQWCGSILCQVYIGVYAVCSAQLLTIVTLAMFKYTLPDDGHRPKHVEAF